MARVLIVEDDQDVANLVAIARAIPASRFKVFGLLSKLSRFTSDEVEHLGRLDGETRSRLILLTDQELEPYRALERLDGLPHDLKYGGTPEVLAQVTAWRYFGSGAV